MSLKLIRFIFSQSARPEGPVCNLASPADYSTTDEVA